ncbi:phosphatase PAP2 family protein [Streptomyces adelaidensis]|uniref:phosphatase PAP2 family protein n=1 Tax=Streptomyces adelaidensis TaxID=2796465 RepID=UPI00190604A3|nr:phosphatase PAP2 family protein [Streptomyces adelaidensis]
MDVMGTVREADRRLARTAVAWGPPWLRRASPALEEAAVHTKVWWAAAGVMAASGGWRGRAAAVAGVAAMATAEVLSNAIAKQLCRRRRPPSEWVSPKELRDRPDSSFFPSGHTAAAVAFTGAVAPLWPAAGAACGVAATLVAAQRLHSGAHYPSDVTAGIAIGLAGAGLVRAAPRLLRRRML